MVAQMSKKEQESPDVYAITRTGLMPAKFVRWEDGLEVLRPVNGRREYSFRPDQVMSVADGQRTMLNDRAEEVRRTYTFTLVARGTLRTNGKAFQVHRVSHPVDAARSYMTTIGAVCSCTCPAAQGIAKCKHVLALEEHSRRVAALERRKSKPAKTYTAEQW